MVQPSKAGRVWKAVLLYKHKGIPRVGLGWGTGADFCLFVVLFGLIGFIVVWFLLLLLYLILENAKELE